MARASNGGTWTAFLAMAFGVVGLLGAFGIYAAQIPFERALAREAALTQLLAASQQPNASAAIDALRPALGDSADHLLTGKLPPPAELALRITAERSRMLTAFGAEARDIGHRLRIVISVFAASGALFGAAILSIVRRSRDA